MKGFHNLILSRLSSLNKSSSHTFHPKNSINNDKKYKCVHISYPRINGNCHIELGYQTGLKFELLPVTNIHVKKNYLPGKYLGFKTVGKVNLIFPSGSTDNSAIKPIVNRAVSPAGKLPILHSKISPAVSSSDKSIAVCPLAMASSYVFLA